MHHTFLNDLWKFDGSQWTWMGGSRNASQNGVYGTKGVAASTNMPGPAKEQSAGRTTTATCGFLEEMVGTLLVFGVRYSLHPTLVGVSVGVCFGY